MPLQPSPASRTNLEFVKTGLRHYTKSVGNGSIQNAAGSKKWPPNVVFREKETTRANTVEPEVITISDSDRASNSSGSDAEVDVWADAFEYQDRMILQRQCNPSSQIEDKENEPPRSARVTSKPPSLARQQWEEAGKNVKEVGPLPADDHFARRTRQFVEIPLPPAHRPLRTEEYFSLANHPTTHGRPPTVIYVTNENQLNGVINLLEGPILSLDLEWLAWERRKNVSLIQLSDAYTVLLIQICHFPRFPACLRKIIEDPAIVKCGVAIMGADMSRLRDVYGVQAQGVCELSFFARLVDREAHGSKNTLISLSNLARTYLGSALAKGPVRCSDWSAQPLSAEQRTYAAIDAYAGYLIFCALERRRQASFSDVWPPVSACPPRVARLPTAGRTDVARRNYSSKAAPAVAETEKRRRAPRDRVRSDMRPRRF